ncbi:TetR/AcrR family transcriptional regulator C-terminal domain-containing protein [Burkholderia cenocepacia]|uniref:TetR/AcrR family transcriptional regulator C-terminal domain-containing protein n=1 Tax=Burkholderia cenocepacia TaxID=95486 RepID=UPI00196B2E23|nr:TetR/AcrR family transcriptional regulator C-terminal domain-containing protein [Burkholderia cenocepacia]MBN3568978.1 TetR/AcrR family transcriptional regulator C-terminal domain-containing protein [Burkholderia cenocepacia]MBR8112390.1 TetR/AcrR family transcriptional regulator C-terminal domain-containing protein [Burkholderia cenocepacia]
MAKIRRDEIVDAALALLDEQGLDALTMRRLAQRLGVESAALYWHYRDKSVLLAEMAAVALARHHTLDVPADTAQWDAWFADNARSFRRALLAHRDGARLHAGSTPDPDAVERIRPKIAYLVRAGLTEQEAGMAMLAAGQFTIGCVLEQQAAQGRGAEEPARRDASDDRPRTSGAALAPIDPGVAFEFGLGLIVDGLRRRVDRA